MELNELNGEQKIRVNVCGATIEVGENDNVREALKAELQRQGVSSFSIIVDGQEITELSQLPDTFGDTTAVEVKLYAKAG